MSFQFTGLTARRDGVVLNLDITGTLPNPSYEICGISAGMDFDGKITIDIRTRSSARMSAQVIVNVSETVNLGRVAPGTNPYDIIVDGSVIQQGRITH